MKTGSDKHRPCWRIGLIATCVLAIASTAAAQFWPGNPYSGYGGWGGYPLGQYNVTREIAAQDRQVGQLRTMQQNLVVQNGIRNTLINQAQSQTNAIQSQRQSNQDWWFQYQSQQMAERRAEAYRTPPAGSVAMAPAVAAPAAPAATPPTASTDIIRWLPLFEDPRFAQPRAAIEAPYRRSPPGLSTPTVDDYRNMVKAVEQMKAISAQMTGEISARDYLQAEAFLKQMGQEASQRADRVSAPPKPE